MNGLLILLSVSFFVMNSLATRVFQLHFQRSKSSLQLYQAVFCLIATVAYFIQSGFTGLPHAMTIVGGIAFGVFFFLAVYCSARGFETGSMSLTGIIVNVSLVIPIVYSWIFVEGEWERVTALQIVGILLLFATFVLSSMSGTDKKTDAEKSKRNMGASILWMVTVLIGFFSNGITAVIQKAYKERVQITETLVDQSGMFMGIAYLTAAVLLFALFLVYRRKDETPVLFKNNVGAVGSMVAGGLGSFIGNGVLMTLSTRVDAAILYPCINGGLCLVAAICSFLFFGEKLSRLKLIGIITGIAAIITLSL